jgi:DNA polymerase (family 10)
MALFLEMDEVPFKPRAYENAIQSIAALDVEIEDLYRARGVRAIEEISGVGKGIARRIAELIDTGKMEDLEDLMEKRPVDILALTSLEGIGPKTVKALYDSLGIRTIAELEAAARSETLRTIPRFGAKSEQKILRQIEQLGSTQGRLPIGDVKLATAAIEAHLSELPEVEQIVTAGSQRRFKETAGDIDILAASRSPQPIMDEFTTMPIVAEVYAKGDKKSMVRLDMGIDADLLVVEPERFGAALLYFTGSKSHNIQLRMIALKLGLKLSEYGVSKDDVIIAARTEEEVYAALGLPWFPPEIREDEGELQAAAAGTLPVLLEPSDLRGDLRVRSEASGGASIEVMAAAAKAMGLEYIGIADPGLSEDEVLRVVDAARDAEAKVAGIRILAGVEADIRADGSVDVSDRALERLDFAGAALHTDLDLPKARQTERLVRALEHPSVGVLFHPTARILGKRSPCEVDMEAVVAAAARNRKVLELDARPHHLDLCDRHVRLAVEAGVPISIASGARRPEHLANIRSFGAFVARRGWATKAAVLNAAPIEDVLRVLGRSRDGRAGA